MRFLIVDDDPESRRVLRHHIAIEWPDAFVEEHQPRSAYGSVDSLDLAHADVVLLGHPLADEPETVFEWLGRLRAKASCPPVIVLGQTGSEALAPEAMNAGAAGYFSKAEIKHRRFIEALRAEAGERSRVSTLAILGRPEMPARARIAAARKHRFIRELHATDISSVHLAESPDGEQVVYKVLRASADSSGGRLFERFLQEFEIIAGLRHPNVVKIFDLGVADDHAFIVMEHCEEGTLAQRIRPAAAAHAAAWLTQIARALAAIHGAGVLHRDLKPSNIMFRRDGTLALIDFGLAKQLRLESAITGAGKIFGTPYYMSPEQGHAEPVDERSDLYSLGCIAYEILTGAKPFTASSAMGLIYKHAHAPRPRLPQAHERFQPLVDRLLAVDPADRFRSAVELLGALGEVGEMG
jgi:DNA-binding NarL/FixJ family response regulator